MVTSRQWNPSGEDSMTSSWSFLRSLSFWWHSWVFLHLSEPKEETGISKGPLHGYYQERPATRSLKTQSWASSTTSRISSGLISPEKTAVDANEKKSGASTAQGLWQHTLLRAARTNLEILNLGGIEHASITFLQRRKTHKQAMRVCDFHHWLNSSVEPWNALRHQPHDWKPRTSGLYHVPCPINLRVSR